MKKNRDKIQTSVDLSDQQSTTIDQTSFDHDDDQVHDSKRPSITFVDDDKQHSNGESSQSDVDDDPIESYDSDAKIDKEMLGQIYVDPMIAKLKITDVILSFITSERNTAEPSIDLWFSIVHF